MPDYRLYFLNPHNGHIEGVEEFHTADDIEAICLVNQRDDAVPLELWSGGRKVARFDGRPDQAAFAPPKRNTRSMSGSVPARTAAPSVEPRSG
jgi:hypothetical protein